MATLEDKIREDHERQMRQLVAERAKMVRVTLLEEYAYDHFGAWGLVTMRDGSTEARVVGQAREADDDEVIDLTRRQRAVIPGRPIHYHLSLEGVENMRCSCQDEPFSIDKTIIMPLPAAQRYFGYWTKFNKILAPGEIANTEDTVEWQKKLVAATWFGYKKRPRDRSNYVGDDWRTLESTAPPAMPKVEIHRLDTQFRKIPNSEFRPWDVYKFENDCVPDRWAVDPKQKIMSFTEDQFREAIAAELAKLTQPQGRAAK